MVGDFDKPWEQRICGEGPWYVEWFEGPSPCEALERVAGQPMPLLLESADTASPLGQHSFLSWNPLQQWRLPVGSPKPLDELKKSYRRITAPTIPNLPGFQGGIAGLWSYDLGRSFEKLPAPRIDEFEVPAIVAGLYDTVIAWDHRTSKTWIISHGLDKDLVSDRSKALDSIARVIECLAAPTLSEPSKNSDLKDAARSAVSLQAAYPVSQWPGVYSSFTHEGFLEAVRGGIEAIRAGDIFQVNLAHRLATPARDSARALYQRLRARNAAPFAGYFDTGQETILSASPERLFQVRSGIVESRPIKGTTMRSWFPESDLAAAASLQASRKDRSENVMIVDLLRNDLSRVCHPDSLQVTQLCEVERYRYVQHLVSAIQGRLSDGLDALDVIAAIFPGGSITGAPKIRAMELIAEIEPTARGAYCGSLGYLGFDGSADLSILIRTVTQSRGWRTFPVGGGIVVGSDPESEYQETWHKARGILASLEE